MVVAPATVIAAPTVAATVTTPAAKLVPVKWLIREWLIITFNDESKFFLDELTVHLLVPFVVFLVCITLLVLTNQLVFLFIVVVVQVFEFMLIRFSWVVFPALIVVASKLVLAILVKKISIWVVKSYYAML